MAIRLSKQMTTQSKRLRKRLKQYNNVAAEAIEFEEAANPDHLVYASLSGNMSQVRLLRLLMVLGCL